MTWLQAGHGLLLCRHPRPQRLSFVPCFNFASWAAKPPFSLGLWVGGGVRSNTLGSAAIPDVGMDRSCHQPRRRHRKRRA